MKIRFSSQHVRIRISPQDASLLSRKESVALHYHLNDPLDLQFCLTLEQDTECAWVKLENQIVFQFNEAMVRNWLNNDEEKISWRINGQEISLEKDYPCEHKIGDESQTFQRPQ